MTITASAGVRVVSGTAKGPLLPDTIQELRSVTVEVEAGTTIERGMFAREIRFLGTPFEVGGPVCAARSIQVVLGDAGEGVIRGGIASGDSLSVSGGSGRLRVVGDVTAARVALRDTIVYGNVLADACSLERTIVLGQVACRGQLELADSMVTAFHVQTAKIRGPTYLLGLAGSALDSIDVSAPAYSLAFLGLEKLAESGDSQGFILPLTSEDVHRAYGDQPVSTLDPFDRILDLSSTPELRDNADYLASVIASACPERVRWSGRRDPAPLEATLWGMLETDAVTAGPA